MFDKTPYEIPDQMRELAERNVEQARAAYSQFMDVAHKARDAVARSQGALAAGALELQSKALAYAEENIDASFRFASDLARARDLKEYLEIQSKYAQRQMQIYTQQAQELGRMMAAAAEKANPKV